MDETAKLCDLMTKHVDEFADFAELDELEKSHLAVHFSEFLIEIADVIAD